MAILPPINAPTRGLPQACHEPQRGRIRGKEHVVLPRHIAALDGLRAIAILAVIFHHCGEYFLVAPSDAGSPLWYIVESGGHGVGLFFALSGFLITGILLDTRERRDYFPGFYWRRALRIWPLYYGFLFAAFLAHTRTFRMIGLAPFALYYRNFLGPDPISDTTLGHFWSLCVEEQFYLLWPLVIYFCAKRFRIALIAFLMVLAFGARFYCLNKGIDPYVVIRLPFCRMDSLLSGAAVAVLIRQGTPGVVRKVSWVAIGLGLVAIIACGSMGTPELFRRLLLLGLTGTALFFGGLVGICVTGLSQVPAQILESRFLKAISTRSYAMYVFHLIPLFGMNLLLNHWNLLPRSWFTSYGLIFVIGLVTYGLAWLSWRFFEEPMLRLKDYRFR